jgi:starch phosphorylase
MTIGFARRAATYKRADLIFTDVQRLKSIAAAHGHLQIIFAGKAHPRDTGGKELIKSVFHRIRELSPHVKAVYIPDYDMRIGQMITAGVDVWLNTPQRPMEASGTSGMKAALNGVPSLSILDGWWVEGCIEGVTGWAIGGFGPAAGQPDDASHDAEALYDKLDRVVVPLFYQQRECFISIMRQAIALSGSRFNAQRMAEQYVTRAYFSV